MKVQCIYNDPDNVPAGVSPDFDYGIEIHKEYLVMGIMMNKGKLLYFIDENGKPGFYPSELFETTDSQLSIGWHFKSYSRKDEMFPYVQAIWGYYELVFDQGHYEQLVERDHEALRIYFKRKIETENRIL